MKIIITGTAGFIGFHLAKKLLMQGHSVLGIDGMTDYYDVNLKIQRHQILDEYNLFKKQELMLDNYVDLKDIVLDYSPEVIIHLAAQAGVRYSLENPRSYIDSNLIGTFNIMDLAKDVNLKHLMMASTSSVYGANTEMPFNENSNSDSSLTIYAATKKATEVMSHSYSNIYKIPTTMFRFFTVYGPWGRPDMALFKFVSAILEDKPIDVYNNGKMYRDFTYIDDLVNSISLLIDSPPQEVKSRSKKYKNDSISPVAPHRIVNIGNSNRVLLTDFIEEIESLLNIEAKKNFLPMQIGDVPATLADTSLLNDLIGFVPSTNYKDGIKNFIDWYLDFYK